jgi:molecular chaperone GrpE (heat shock protein)
MNTSDDKAHEQSTPKETPPALQQLPEQNVAHGQKQNPFIGILDAVGRACEQHLQDMATLHGEMMAALEPISQNTAAAVEVLHMIAQAIVRLETAVARQIGDAAAQLANTERIDTQLAQLAKANHTQAHNLEQVRLQGEGLARNFEKLSHEVIEREIKDPFFIALAHHYESVFALTGRQDIGDADLQSMLQSIRGLLEDYNVELIHPDDGERVDPRRHHPVQQALTQDSVLHGRIASTFNVGLASGQRLIQPARVEVFICAGSPSTNSPTT